jgi:ATP/maltotriose-dependent transcriptional regulator MalT/two-component SAPR family response regulator
VNDLLYQRKITCPALPAVHLHREALVERVSSVLQGPTAAQGDAEGASSPHKLVLLHAPAGYGKTTLLADFAQRTTLPCCWYVLDQADTDRITFLTVLLMSIRQCFPNFGRALDPLLTGFATEHADSPHRNYFGTVIDTLATTIEKEIPGRFVLLLCNYQEINERQEMNDLISALLHKLPRQCTLVIESRIIPGLDFAQLLAGQMIFGIGRDSLRFTARQIRELAHLQGVASFSESEADQLARTFDGWIAGILLGTRLGNIQQFPQSQLAPLFADPSQRPVVSPYLFSYVVNEVFKSHQQASAFLKQACVLQEMTPAMCAALLDIPSMEAHTHLHYLEQQSLFVTHSGEGTHLVYTCSPVLRKLFYDELRHGSTERFIQLHRRAAELLSASGNYSQAIYHALEASLSDIAASLIIEAAEQMMSQGHAETLARWIDAFPPATMHHYPQLQLIRATIYLRQGNHNAAIPLLDAAGATVQVKISQASPLDIQNFPALQAEIAIVRSKVLWRQREYRQGQSICQQVLDSLPADEVSLRAEAHMRLGLCDISLGDLTSGIAQIQKALQLWGRHTIKRQTADGHSLLARAYGFLGNFALAEHHITRALACWEQLQDNWGKIDNLVRVGIVKVWQGAFSEAETFFQKALSLARGPIHYLRGQAYALDCLGIFYQRQEQYERALAVTEEALALARQISDPYLINEVLGDLAMIYLFMGDTATAMILTSEIEIQTAGGEPIQYEQAIRDLTYGTVYLYQGQYSQAGQYLSASEAFLGKAGRKQEHLQALLCLAAYHLTRDQLSEATHCLESAAAIIPICEGYERLAHQEIRRLPGLLQAIRSQAQLTRIREVLHLEQTPQAAPVSEQRAPEALQEPMLPVQTAAPSHRIDAASPRCTLSIRALGEPAILLRQEPITHWRMARAMELCFYLLDCARPMRKETIITALWPEVDEQTTRTFYSTIYYLRQALGGETVIVAKGGAYALRLEALYGQDVWYDVRAFEEARVKAKLTLDNGQDSEARAFYQTMVELYRGDYVQSFYSDWCTVRRDELRNAYLEACQQLAQIAWRQEQLDESILHWQHILAVDNWLEEAHYGLMRCYARQGKRGLALRQYQRCKETLEREFGAAPKATIQSFYQRLMGSS